MKYSLIKTLRAYAIIAIVLASNTLVFGFGEPPSFDNETEPILIRAMNKTSLPARKEKEEDAVKEDSVVAVSDESELFDQRKKVAQFLKLKQFKQAKNALEKISSQDMNEDERVTLDKLDLFDELDVLEDDNAKLFKRKSNAGTNIEKNTKRLYAGAQTAFIADQYDLVKDLLIQILNYDRRHYKAKKFLELGLNASVGTYTVENVEAKYWKLSLVNLYAGYPEKSVENLKALEAFDPENPLIFERMGSAFYNMGEPKKAIEAWKRALYLNPKNKDLDSFIKNAQVEVIRQDNLVRDIMAKKKTEDVVVNNDEDMQLLRVVNDSNVAYSYAQEVRTQMKGINVVVEEMDNGKWAIKIPKKKKVKK